MENISIIACVGKNMELGKNNDLIWHLPGDLKYFKKMTLGKTVVMGRKTFESLPKILPQRRNIILQRKKEEIDGAFVANNVEMALDMIGDDEAFIIGGASVYQVFLEYADKLYLTEVDAKSDADVYFPSFDKTLYEKDILGCDEDNGIKYQYVLYKKIK